MKEYDIYALAHCVPVTVICALAGCSVMPFTPWAAWSLYALSVINLLLTVEIAMGWPVMRYVMKFQQRQRADGIGQIGASD